MFFKESFILINQLPHAGLLVLVDHLRWLRTLRDLRRALVQRDGQLERLADVVVPGRSVAVHVVQPDQIALGEAGAVAKLTVPRFLEEKRIVCDFSG